MADFAPMSIAMTLVLTLGWMVRTVSTNRRLKEVARLQAELHAKLIEKFGTAQELLQYLESEAGRRLVESATLDRANPYSRILGSVQTGILVLFAGVAMLGIRGMVSNDAVRIAGVLGFFGLLLGAGFLVSAGASYFLSRSWGLIQQPGAEPAAE